MRPVSAEFPCTQAFGSLATAGVVGDPNGTQVQVLVSLYGNYQPFGHAGCDIGCPVGTPVYAIKAGTVVWCDWDMNLPGDDSTAGYLSRWDFYRSFGGRILLLKHDDGSYSDYCHLSKFLVTLGQRVNEGDQIALSGDSSGGQDGVLGPHLHTEWFSDLTYSTGNGLIYGREDPEPHFGNTTPTVKDWLDMASIDDVRAVVREAIQEQFVDAEGVPTSLKDVTFILRSLVHDVPAQVLKKQVPRGGADSGGGMTSLEGVVAYFDQSRLETIKNGSPTVLQQKVQLKDGRVANVAAVLDELITKANTAPVNSTTLVPAAIDTEALVTRLKAELPAATVELLATKLTTK